MRNFYAFYTELVNEYEITFNRNPYFANILRADRPERQAYRVIGMIDAGWSVGQGLEVSRVCDRFGIRHTLKGIREFWLDSPTDVGEVKP